MDTKFELKGVGCQLYVYADKVVIERKGVVGFISQGLAGAKTILMSSIESVQFKKGGMLVNGFIQFGVLGGRQVSGGVSGAANDENSVVFYAKDNDLAQQIKEYIEECIINKNNPQVTIESPISAADEIKKLKELLDMKIITQDEFDKKKKDLLGF